MPLSSASSKRSTNRHRKQGADAPWRFAGLQSENVARGCVYEQNAEIAAKHHQADRNARDDFPIIAALSVDERQQARDIPTRPMVQAALSIGQLTVFTERTRFERDLRSRTNRKSTASLSCRGSSTSSAWRALAV